MLEINITHMVEDAEEMPMLSGSCAELGSNAGKITWRNSLEYAEGKPLLQPDQIQEVKDYFAEFGAWDAEEIAAWTDAEVQALAVQWVAGTIREMEYYDSYDEYQKAAEEGRADGMIFQTGGQWYFYFSH
jgi:hypothetical protein